MIVRFYFFNFISILLIMFYRKTVGMGRRVTYTGLPFPLLYKGFGVLVEGFLQTSMLRPDSNPTSGGHLNGGFWVVSLSYAQKTLTSRINLALAWDKPRYPLRAIVADDLLKRFGLLWNLRFLNFFVSPDKISTCSFGNESSHFWHSSFQILWLNMMGFLVSKKHSPSI
jgi:hypothetical protein